MFRVLGFPLVMLLAVALLVGGCGEEKKANDDKNASSKTRSSEDSSKDDTATSPTPATDGSEASEGGGDGAGASEAVSGALSDLAGKRKLSKAKVTYKMDMGSTAADQSGMGTTEMTLAMDGEKAVVEISGMKMFQERTAYTICMDQTKSCFKVDDPKAAESQGLNSAVADFMGAADALENEGDLDGVKQEDDRTYAGRDGACWSYTWAGLGGSTQAESCLDKETGVPLYMSWSVDTTQESGKFAYEATAYSTPTDADFKPQYPVTDMSKLTDAAGGGQIDPAEAQKLAEQMSRNQ